jgi:hypothetical protein
LYSRYDFCRQEVPIVSEHVKNRSQKRTREEEKTLAFLFSKSGELRSTQVKYRE